MGNLWMAPSNQGRDFTRFTLWTRHSGMSWGFWGPGREQGDLKPRWMVLAGGRRVGKWQRGWTWICGPRNGDPGEEAALEECWVDGDPTEGGRKHRRGQVAETNALLGDTLILRPPWETHLSLPHKGSCLQEAVLRREWCGHAVTWRSAWISPGHGVLLCKTKGITYKERNTYSSSQRSCDFRGYPKDLILT